MSGDLIRWLGLIRDLIWFVRIRYLDNGLWVGGFRVMDMLMDWDPIDEWVC